MHALRSALAEEHPADLAELLAELNRQETLVAFRALPRSWRPRCFPICRRMISRP